MELLCREFLGGSEVAQLHKTTMSNVSLSPTLVSVFVYLGLRFTKLIIRHFPAIH